jgi:hypothetical protein
MESVCQLLASTSAACGQMDQDPPPVLRVGTPISELGRDQLVDGLGQARRRQHGVAGGVAHPVAGAVRQQLQHPPLTQAQSLIVQDRGQLLGDLVRGPAQQVRQILFGVTSGQA